MHSIYSKLKSDNAMNGKVKGKAFSVEFLYDKNTKVNDDQFDALMEEAGSTLKGLLDCGDFVEDAESASSEISSLKGEITKLEKALKNAEEKTEHNEKKESEVGKAEEAVVKAEDAMEAATDADSKKKALKDVKEAKALLKKAQKADK